MDRFAVVLGVLRLRHHLGYNFLVVKFMMDILLSRGAALLKVTWWLESNIFMVQGMPKPVTVSKSFIIIRSEPY